MKKYVSMLVMLSVLFICLSSCMTEKRLAEYQPLDYNIIWEDTEKKISDGKIGGFDDYYQIKGIPKEEYLAFVGYDMKSGIGGYPYEPTILVHQSKGTEYQLNMSSGKLILRCGLEKTDDESYWSTLGQKLRFQVITEINNNLAESILKSIDTCDYVNDEEYEGEFQFIELPNEEVFVYLGIQFAVKDYESLTWMATIKQIQENQYVIEINDNYNRYEMKYIRCSDELNAVIQEIVNEYGLVFTP